MKLFRETKQSLKDVENSAVRAVETAIDRLMRLRERTGVRSDWNLAAVGLDTESIRKRLTGIADPALAELNSLQAEHDLDPKILENDPVLSELDRIFKGRLGSAYPTSKLRALVDEAHEFRFPNEVPPGFRDWNKETRLRAAGDFILWRQTLDKAISCDVPDLPVLVVTRDSKPDWWAMDAKNNPIAPRPELVQEMRDEANADLGLVTLTGFLENAAKYLSSPVSAETLSEAAVVDEAARLKTILRRVTELSGVRPMNSETVHAIGLDFEYLVTSLFIAMGCEVIGKALEGSARHADILLRCGSEVWAVELKHYSRPLDVQVIRAVTATLEREGADRMVLVTLGPLTNSAKKMAIESGLVTIDMFELEQLLDHHIDGWSERAGDS